MTVVVLIELDDSVKERIYNFTRQTCPMLSAEIRRKRKGSFILNLTLSII
jgi:hypothetical protein